MHCERSLSTHLLQQGAPEPKPLRDEQYLFGKPGLSQYDQLKVNKANDIYRYAIQLMMILFSTWLHYFD